MLSPLGQGSVKSLVAQFVSRLLSFRGIVGGLVKFISSMPFRYEDYEDALVEVLLQQIFG